MLKFWVWGKHSWVCGIHLQSCLITNNLDKQTRSPVKAGRYGKIYWLRGRTWVMAWDENGAQLARWAWITWMDVGWITYIGPDIAWHMVWFVRQRLVLDASTLSLSLCTALTTSNVYVVEYKGQSSTFVVHKEFPTTHCLQSIATYNDFAKIQ